MELLIATGNTLNRLGWDGRDIFEVEAKFQTTRGTPKQSFDNRSKPESLRIGYGQPVLKTGRNSLSDCKVEPSRLINLYTTNGEVIL